MRDRSSLRRTPSPPTAAPTVPPSATDFDLAHSYGSLSFGARLPIPHTLLEVLAVRARTHRDSPFLTVISGAGDAATLTYGEFDALSGRLATWLERACGVAEGDVVGLLPRNDAVSMAAVLGVLRAKGSVLLLNPADPAPRLRQQTEALSVRTVVRSPGVCAEHLPEALPLPHPAEVAGLPEPPPRSLPSPEADAFFFGTSGSTAASKLVAQCHYNAAVNAEAVSRHHGISPGDRLLACLPIHHVNALHLTLFGTLWGGGHVMFAHALDPFGYPRLVERFRPRIASVVPSILEALLGTWRGVPVPAELEYFISAAAPLPAATARAVAGHLGRRVVQGYGLTETVNFSTTLPRNLSGDAYRRLVLEAEIPSVGVALYGNEVAVLAPDGSPVAPGAVGEVCVRGHNVMMRYHGNPEATADAFRGGWFHTQDLGREIEEPESGRRFLVLTGRTKNIAKVRGETVSLDEVDRVLRSLRGVVDGAAVAVPDEMEGEVVLVAVVCPPALTDAELRAELSAYFPPPALPRSIVRMDAIPRTATGKLLRPQLARTLATARTR